MKMMHQDSARSAVTSSSGLAATIVALSANTGAFFPTILNSLFDSQIPLSCAANPMNFRHFGCQAVGGVMKFPVIFPVSREFMPPEDRRNNARRASFEREQRRATGVEAARLAKNKCPLEVYGPEGHWTQRSCCLTS
jgi:hypothetical protein